MKMVNVQEEFKDYIEAGFKLVLTQDKSFSLMQEGLDEEMHARGGAVTESKYIYKEALDLFFKSDCSGEVLSVGLGLGYNEILTAQSALSFKIKNLEILSYEKEEFLREAFLRRLKEPELYPNYWGAILKSQEEIREVVEFLKAHLILNASFDEEAVLNLKQRRRAILFDAYSNKTSPELWGESFLDSFLLKSKKGSVLATYAATGVLNRALKKALFKNLKKKGFLNKRESTLAVKEE